jgi:chromosome segregation ATPase
MSERPDRAQAMISARQLASRQKLERLRAAAAETLGRGEDLVLAQLARRAGVSRKFCYQPAVRTMLAELVDASTRRNIGRAEATARVTAASLRADLENYRAQNQRLRRQVGELERRLSEALGRVATVELDAGGEPAERFEGASEQIGELEQRIFELEEKLARRLEELEAVREINRELVAARTRALSRGRATGDP